MRGLHNGAAAMPLCGYIPYRGVCILPEGFYGMGNSFGISHIIKKLPPCNRTKALTIVLPPVTTYSDCLFLPCICVPVTEELRQPLLLTFRGLRLRSDVQKHLTHTGLPPPPARCKFQINPTVFVIVFPVLSAQGYYKKKPANSQGIAHKFHQIP